MIGNEDIKAGGGWKMIPWVQPRSVNLFVFHSVEAKGQTGGGSWSTSESLFQDQLDFIAENFQVATVSDVINLRNKPRKGKPLACITFDDGDPSWMGLVRSELADRDLRATFYVATNQIFDRPIWHDRLRFCLNAIRGSKIDLPWLGTRNLPYASVNEKLKAADSLARLMKYQAPEVRERMLCKLEEFVGGRCESSGLSVLDLRALVSDGHEIGSHTKSHPILTHCSDSFAENEIFESKEILSDLLGQKICSFSYPNGKPGLDYLAKHVEMVRKAGYESAVATARGGLLSSTSVWEIPRFSPWGRTWFSKRRQVFINSLFRSKSVEQQSGERLRILFVENGSGFGGAVVALQSLIQSIPDQSLSVGVVAGLDCNFKEASCVESVYSASTHSGENNSVFLFLSGVARKLPRLVGKGLVGRLDDLFLRLPYFLKLLSIVVRFRPHVIHGNNEIVSNREAMLVARCMRIPYVQHVRGPFPKDTRLGYLLNGPSIFLPVSRWLYFSCIEAGVSVSRLMHIYDGVPKSSKRHGNKRPELCGSQGDGADVQGCGSPIVAMVGMLVPWKGQELFIDAVGIIFRSLPHVKFLIVGAPPAYMNGEYKDRLIKKVQNLGLEGIITFTGQIEDVAQKMSQFDVVVSASIDPEPLGLVMIEAMREGCYFVGPDHGATAEFIDSRDRGVLFKSGSAQALAEALEVAINYRSFTDANTRDAAKNLPIEVDMATHAARVVAVHEAAFVGLDA